MRFLEETDLNRSKGLQLNGENGQRNKERQKEREANAIKDQMFSSMLELLNEGEFMETCCMTLQKSFSLMEAYEKHDHVY